LKKCVLHSGHYYFQRLSDCPWCGIESHAQVRLFNFLLPGADSRRGHFRLDEIWKEIEFAEAPDTPMIPAKKMPNAPKLSADVAPAVRRRRIALIGAIALSASQGFMVGLGMDPPLSFLLLILLVAILRIVFRSDQNSLDNLQTIFQSRLSMPEPDDPLVREVPARHLHAPALTQPLHEHYHR